MTIKEFLFEAVAGLLFFSLMIAGMVFAFIIY